MRTISLVIGNKTQNYTGPSSWPEVSQDLALKLFNLVKSGLTKKYLLLVVPTLVYKIPMDTVKMLLNARRSYRKYHAAGDPDDYESLSLIADQILNSCKWIYFDPPPATWLLKQFNVNTKRLDAPADRLEDFTFGEFMFTELYAVTDLAKLCSVLYRRQSILKVFGISDMREEFKHRDIEKYAQFFRQEKFNDVRNLVAWNYSGMLQHLRDTFPQVFEKPAAKSVSSSPEVPAAPTDWIGIAMDFCDNDSIRFHAMEQENLYAALKMIQNRIKKNKEIEASYKK